VLGRLSGGVFSIARAAPRQPMPARCDETWTISWRYWAGRRLGRLLHNHFASGNLAGGPVVAGPARFTRIEPPMFFPGKSPRTRQKFVSRRILAARRVINAASGRESLTAKD